MIIWAGLKVVLGVYIFDKAFCGGKLRMTKAIDKGATKTINVLFGREAA